MSKGGSTTSTQNTAPWSAQQPFLSGLFGGAQGAYNTFGSNPASSVAGFTAPQVQSFGDINAAAGGNPGGNIAGVNNTASQFTGGLLNGDFLNSNPSQPGYAAMTDPNSIVNRPFNAFASGAMLRNPATGFDTSLLSQGPGGINLPGMDTLSSYASGGQTNPFLANATQALTDPIVRAYQTATAPGIASQFAADRPFQSGAEMNADSQARQDLVKQLGNVTSPFLAQMLPVEQQMQLGAAGTAGSEALGGINAQLGAGSQYGTQLSDILAGATGLSGNVNTGLAGESGNYNAGANRQIQGLFATPSVTGSNWQSIGNLQNAGAQQQNLNQSLLNSPWDLLNHYAGLIQGQYGGTGSSTTPYFTNPAAGALGGAAAGSMFGPWGAAAGGLLGLFGSH